MAKYYHYLLLSCLLLLAGCQSVEYLAIDYMLPADVSFPPSLKRVGVVNNMPEVPENKPILAKEKKKDDFEIARKVDYYNGNATIATETLAEALADENYFNEVIICDSALRTGDITPREAMLSQEEVNRLVDNTDVDFLIALENVQIHTTRKIKYMRDWGVYYGTVDAKVYPTVSVYLPNRGTPMVTVNSKDSILREEAGNGPFVQSHLISEEDVIKQASEFAGTIPVKKLLPYWKTASRYLFCGGSVNMRDAAVYVREKQWETAIDLWKQTYATKKGKKKMQAAYVGCRLRDAGQHHHCCRLGFESTSRSTHCGRRRQKDLTHLTQADLPNYVLTTLYVTELKEREEGLARLNMQMQRFNNDF